MAMIVGIWGIFTLSNIERVSASSLAPADQIELDKTISTFFGEELETVQLMQHRSGDYYVEVDTIHGYHRVLLNEHKNGFDIIQAYRP